MRPIAAAPLAIAFLFVSGGVAANEPQGDQPDPAAAPELETHPDRGFVFEGYTRGTMTADADFDDGIGEFQYTEFIAGIKANRLVGDSGLLSIDFNAGLINYDITPSPTSVLGDAANIGAEFDHITVLSLTGIYANQSTAKSTWFVGGGVFVGRENGADFGDSIDWMLTGGYKHKINNKLELGLGVAMRTRLDDSVLIVPVPQITYAIDEYWSITGQGIGLKINYKASDSLDYGLSGQYESTTFRLDDTHSAAPEGMVTHQRFPLAFYAKYQPNDTLEISGRVGGLLAGELEILDTNGNDLTRQDIDTVIFGSINLSFKF